jgi:hypothetical protein
VYQPPPAAKRKDILFRQLVLPEQSKGETYPSFTAARRPVIWTGLTGTQIAFFPGFIKAEEAKSLNRLLDAWDKVCCFFFLFVIFYY